MPIVVDDTWSTAVPSPRAALVSKVAGLFGAQNDPDLLSQSLTFLDDAVKDMNSHLYEFNKVFEQGIPLVAGTKSYSINSTFYKESQAYLEKSDATFKATLVYIPWQHFQRLFKQDASQGVPQYYSLFNVQEEGKVYLHQPPDTATATDYVLDIEYYRRIPLVSSVGDGESLSVPQEVETALVYSAQKRLSIQLQGAGHNDTSSLHQLEQQALERLKAVDRRHPDEQLRFRIVDFARGPRYAGRSLYIKLT